MDRASGQAIGRAGSSDGLVLSVLLLAGAVYLAALLGLDLMRLADRIAPIWLANGIAVAVLVRADRRRWPPLLAAAVCAVLAANLSTAGSSHTLSRAAVLACCNGAEILAVAAILRQGADAGVSLTATRGLLALAAIGTVGASASCYLWWATDAPFVGVWRSWFLADSLGAGIMVPLILIALDSCTWRRLRGADYGRLALLVIALLATTILVFSQSTYPLMFVPLVPLLALAATFGFEIGVLSLAILLTLAIGFTVAGSGPASINPAVPLSARVMVLQGFCCLAMLMVFLVSTILAEWGRLTNALRSEQQRLAASEARFRAYFEASPDGIVVFSGHDKDTWRYEAVSPAAEAILGVDASHLVGRVPAELGPMVPTREIEARLEECLAGRVVVNYPDQYRVGGKLRDMDVMLSPLLSADGTPFGALASIRDVTDNHTLQRLADQRLAELKLALKSQAAIFENSLDVLFMVQVAHDAQGAPSAWSYEAISPSVEQLIGLPPAAFIGRSPRDVFASGAWGGVEENFRRTTHSGQPTFRAATYQFPGGTRDIEVTLVPVRDADTNRVVRLIGVTRDVTARNQIDERLRQGQKMDAIGKIAAGVAHDFNNVLQSLTSNLELVMDEIPAGTVAHEHLGIALNSAARGSYLTNHLLTYARKQTLNPRLVEVGAFLTEMRTMLSRTLGPHIGIALDIRAPGIHARVDPAQFETALLNLAINASHAMPKSGTLTLACSTREAPEDMKLVPGTYLVVAVADTGTGMDGSTLQRAFEPFFTTKGAKGTGLGLAMVQEFSRQSGGDVRIDSAPGQGTRVEILLPAEASVASRAEPRPARNAGSLLLVDDLDDVLVATSVFLEAAGFRVRVAASAPEALLQLSAGRFDMLITDCAMPGASGLDLVEQARALQPGLPAMIITGLTEPVGLDLEQTNISLLRKPFRRAELVAAIAAGIGQPPRPPQDASSAEWAEA